MTVRTGGDAAARAGGGAGTPTGADLVATMGGALGWGVVSRAIRFALTLATSILIVRALGPRDYGHLAILRMALAFVGAVLGFGLGQAVLRYLPVARVAGSRGAARSILRAAILIPLAGSLIATLAALLARDVAWPGLGEGRGGLVALGVGLLAFELVLGTLTYAASAFYDARALAGNAVLGNVLLLVLLAVLLPLGAGIAGVLAAGAVANLAMSVHLLLRVRTLVGALPANGEGAVPFRKVFGYSVPFAAIAVLNLVTWRQSETLLLGAFRGPVEAGIFDLAYKLPQQILEFVPGAIWPLVMAGFAESFARDRASLSRAVHLYAKLLFLLVVPVTFLGALFADRALLLLYGEGMRAAGPYCRIFFVIFSLSFFSTPLSMVLYVLERTGWNLALYAVNAALTLGLDLLLIPRWGLPGAVLPTALMIAVSPLLYLLVLRRLGAAVTLPGAFLVRCYLASAALALLLPLRLLASPALTLVLAAALALPAFWVGARATRLLGPDELRQIDRLGSPRLARFLRAFAPPGEGAAS